MLFELRDGVPDVSAGWREVRDVFLSGRAREAWQRVAGGDGPGRPETVAEWVLLIEIARACGAHRRSLALSRLAYRAFPDDLMLQLLEARSLLTRGRHWPAIRFLEEREPQPESGAGPGPVAIPPPGESSEEPTATAAAAVSSDGTSSDGTSSDPAAWSAAHRRGLWAAQLANTYGDAGFEASCQKWLAEAARLPGADSPRALYARSCANHGMRRWDEAIRLAAKCVEAAPGWVRAQAFYINCLLSQGRIDEARSAIAAVEQLGYQDSTLDISAAMLAFSLGEFVQAETLFRAFLDNWPQADFAPWVRRSLCILLVELGRPDEARQVAGGEEEKLALPSLPETLSGAHRFVPLPLIAQNKDECVPTCVAMAVWPQGRRVAPGQLYREMHGRDGVALWRMREWGEQHGYRVVPVQLTPAAVARLLGLNVPLIGVLEGSFHGHVEVVCGYHDDLDALYVRDPMHWAPMAYPRELAFARYELHGALLAFIPSENGEALAAAESFASREGAALLDLARAVAGGDRPAAETASAQIPDDSRVAFLRDLHGRGVVISPGQFHDRMAALAEDQEANPVARFRALLTLGSEEAQKVLQQLLEQEQDRLGAGGRRYLQLLRCMHEGNWPRAGVLVDQLLISGGSVAQIWELRSDVRAELGDQAGSSESLNRAIELEPLRLSLRQKSLEHRINRLTYAEYLAEFDDLLAGSGEEKRMLWGRAMVLCDGPDGAAYEQAIREYQRWFPRDPMAYVHLRQWLLLQGRRDLAEEVLDAARQLMPADFPAEPATENPEPAAGQRDEPAAGADESGDITESATSPTPPAAAPSGDRSAGDDSAGDNSGGDSGELPESPSELLDHAWNPDDARRPAALQSLQKLETEGRLAWYERARLLACRLVLGTDSPEVSADDARQLLPESPPGAVTWFADAVASMVTDYDPPIAVAKTINDWIERIVPNFRSFVGLWFSRVLLFEKSREVERALRELEELLQHYPAYSSALYRMGVVKYRQQDYRGAARYLRQALDVNPGLAGAIQVLRTVCEETDDVPGTRDCIGRMRRKFPRDFTHLQDEVVATFDGESPAAARTLLAAAAGFPNQRVQLLEVRLDLREERLEDAERRLASVSVSADADEDLFDDWLQLRLSVATQREDQPAILAVCEEGLARWPDATRLKEIRADCLAKTDPRQALQLLEDVLHHGEPEPGTVWKLLQLADAAPDEKARQVVLAAPEDRRQDLAELFSVVMADPELLRWNAPYLEWARGEFPESDRILWRLATHYNLNDRAREAVKFAQELYDRNPDNPEAIRMLGRCLIDQDAKRALPYLERVCERNRSAAYLFDLARCCQIAGHTARAREVHWEILEQNPYMSASWTNLFVFGESHVRLWPFVGPFLKRGCGTEDEYCLVAVVKIALALKQQVPMEWFPLAVQRLQVLGTHPGFRDERPRLRKAVQAWLVARPADRPSTPPLPDGFFSRLLARYLWPGCRWVPEPPSGN